jgi:amidase
MNGGAVEGCVTRTVADTAAIYDAISLPDTTAWYHAPPLERPLASEVGFPPGRLRIAYCTAAPTGAPVARACIDAVEHTARLLDDLGHDVFEGSPEWPDPVHALHTFLTFWNTNLAYYPIADWDRVEPLSAAMRAQAQNIDSLTHVRTVAALQIYSRQIVRSWGKVFDVLLTPTLAGEPPAIGALFEGTNGDPMAPLMNAAAVAPFTPFFNVTGQPAISVPVYWTAEGLPIGVQLIGRPWGEPDLVRLASQLEAAVPWAHRRPPVAVRASGSG